MASEGLLQPIVVRPVGDRFEITAGHRRYRAARALGWTTITAVIKSQDEASSRHTMLIENIQREELHPLDEATALGELLLHHHQDARELARALGKSRSWIDARLGLLDADPAIQDALASNTIGLGAAHALMEITDRGWRRYYLTHTINEGASVSKIRAWAAEANQQIERQIQQGLPATAPSLLEPPPEPLYPCWGCRERKEIFRLRQMPICDACLQEIAQLAGQEP